MMNGLGRSTSAFKGLLIGWINGFLTFVPNNRDNTNLLYLIGTRKQICFIHLRRGTCLPAHAN